MNATAIRSAYLEFFSKAPRNHAVIPAARLVPENDPTTLFTSSGMQQLVPYLKGESHSMGARLVNSQPCFRAEDIDEVGDNRHTTFFEMLGNWSLGDYFKADQLPWFFEFLTTEIGLDPNRLYVTVFAGDEAVPKDEESIAIWQQIFDSSQPAKNGTDGFDPATKIYLYDARKNWWSRSGIPSNMPIGEIGGPDSEVFYDFDPSGSQKIHQQSKYANQPCHINCDCGRFMEIGNSVFMQYIKTESGFKPLPKQNVDFGGGLERIAAAANNDPDMFRVDVLYPLIQNIEAATNTSYQSHVHQPAMRVIADHMRAATFLIAQGVTPANKLQGYFLRRLLRRSLVKLQSLKPDINLGQDDILSNLAKTVASIFQTSHLPSVDLDEITAIITDEQARFAKTLAKGLKMIQSTSADSISGKFAFDLYQTYGFPLEITEELVKERGISVDTQAFRDEFKKHQEISRAGSQALFKGGLADHSEIIVKYHTTTHLLHTALRQVLGSHVQQMGSNITAKRLRFDFKHPEKLNPDQLSAIEAHINAAIAKNYPVHKSIESKDQALESGALAFFRDKYPDTVSVYTIGHNPDKDWHSKELCGGPHVTSTGEIGPMTIVKEEAVGAGIRRIYIQSKN
jgi:alanyl-tRNA synthetase